MVKEVRKRSKIVDYDYSRIVEFRIIAYNSSTPDRLLKPAIVIFEMEFQIRNLLYCDILWSETKLFVICFNFVQFKTSAARLLIEISILRDY